jgi:conjugative transfer region lipoprotein (TIGR03751 family)
MPMLNSLNTMIWISVMLMCVILAGCATGDKESILPQEGPTMKEVYQGHFTGRNTGIEHRNGEMGDLQGVTVPGVGTENRRKDNAEDKAENNAMDLTGYTRNAHNEIQQIFPRLNNKTLILYIFPHLSRGERHPVPGYSTAFTFYEKTEYALPGEIEEGH